MTREMETYQKPELTRVPHIKADNPAEFVVKSVVQAKFALENNLPVRTVVLNTKTPSGRNLQISNLADVSGLNLRGLKDATKQTQLSVMLNGAINLRMKGDDKKADKLIKQATSLRKQIQNPGKSKARVTIAGLSMALAACTIKTPEAVNPSPTAPVVSELVPTEELEQQMIDSFDLNGQDLKVKISSPDGVREDLPISDIERVITVSDLNDPVYSEVSIAQMRLEDQEAAAIEFWVFTRKDGQAPDSQFIIWTPVGADASGVRLNAVKLAVDNNNIAGVPQNPEVVGTAIVPGDTNQPIDITIYKPNQKDQKFEFNLGQALFRSIDSILAWDAQVAEAGNENPDATTTAVAQVTSTTAAPVETSTSVPTVQPTLEATPSPEPTEAPRLVEMDRVMMEFDGRQVPFTINTLEGESNILPDLEKITGWTVITTNPLLEDKESKFGRLLQASLWAVNEAGHRNVPYEDFIQNPSEYPINLIFPGGIGSGQFTIDEIKAGVNFNLINENDWRFQNDSGFPVAFYFDRNRGLLEIYWGVQNLTAVSKEATSGHMQYSGQGLEQSIGQVLCPLLHIIVGVRQSNLSTDDFIQLLDQVKTISDFPNTNTTGVGYLLEIKDTGFWAVGR